MDDLNNEFEQLMQRARAGCQEAANEIYQRYGDHVRRVVRRVLRRRLRRHYDSTDFTQSVWATFFEAPTDQYDFPTSAALIAFLSKVACHKVMQTTRRKLGTARHNANREESLDEPHPDQGGAVGEALPAHIATPSQYVMADERWQRMVQGLPPGHRRVLELLRDGHSPADVVRTLGIDGKVIQRLRKHLSRHMEAQ
jgi:DNA-directed RNA polymerase specialized sigma24 family protein